MNRFGTAAMLSFLSLTTCTGHVVMTPMSPDAVLDAYQKNTDIDGIIVFRPEPMIEVDEFTQINTSPDPSKTVLSNECNHIQSRKLLTLADWQHPYRLHYEHGLLETYTFGATLTSDGILTAINTQSTPDQGKTFQNLASAASSAAGIPRVAPPPNPHVPPQPNCTTTPIFVGYEYPPVGSAIKPYGTTPKTAPQ
jgi:hypothetical protein